MLIIDDDEMVRELLAALLETQGYAVSTAESGAAGLAMLDSAPARPEVVLTDMQMPGSTPGQLAGRLRRACGRGTLLLAMSGSKPAPAVLARYDGFLLKPFGAAEFASAVEAARRVSSSAPAKTAPAGMKAVRTTKRSQGKKSGATLALAASAEEPASNRNMDAAPQSATHRTDSLTPETAPVLDEAIYGQLAVSMPAPQLREMYAMCLDDARARIDSMRSLAAAHDDAQFMREAHAIKGSCGMLGATELHRRASALERFGLAHDGSAVNSLDELSNACDRLERMLGARA